MSKSNITENSVQTISSNALVQYASTKKFAGSKTSDFYGEGYFLNGQGSNYGYRNETGKQLFVPYEEQYYLPKNRELAKYIINMYKPKTAMVLGCARGYLVKAFRELGVDCKGIDISEWAIKHAPDELSEHLYVGDICDLSFFSSASFDVTVALDVFEHIAVPDLFTALDEASRITRDTILINVPVNDDDSHPDQTDGNDKSHISIYSATWWREKLMERDFTIFGQDINTHPDGSLSATFIFRKSDVLCVNQRTVHVAKSAKKQLVNIILLNWNGINFTPKCIETLYKNTSYPFNLIVVDNQSTDGSKKYLEAAQQIYPNMHTIFSECLNSGFANGINIGLQYLKNLPDRDQASYVLLLNNDTLFLQKDWLNFLVQALDEDPSVGVASPMLLYPDGHIQYAGGTFNAQLQPYHIGRFKEPTDEFLKGREVPWATFACALIRRNLLVEGLSEQYLLGTFEDVDFCTKARFNGYKIMYIPEASIYHYEGATTVLNVNPEQFNKQQIANATLFQGRWANWLHMNRGAYPEIYAK
jgi:GT2 family glycosyltransferase